MMNLAQFSLLAAGLLVTTGASPLVPSAEPLIAFAPTEIIEGGTVSTLPKSVKSRGKVVVLRGRADRAAAAPVRKAPVARAARETPAKSCACGAAAVSAGGGSSGEIVELRTAETGLRVMILGPDGLARTRFVTAPPGATTRSGQDD